MRATGGEPAARGEIARIATLFLRLGATAFGGPASHLALMEDEVVRRRGWMSREAFLDLLGATNLIPGPNSTEMAMHIGRLRAGWIGLVTAGLCFILPAGAITLALAWAYVRYGALPEAGALLYGVKPMIIAIVLQALWALARAAVKTRTLGLLGLAATIAIVAGVHELVVLSAGGLIALAMVRPRTTSRALMLAVPAGAASAAGPVAFGLAPLFLLFLKIGSILFGSGYVLLAFLRADLVERRHWLTEPQLLDAIVAGQITPGPVLTTATFIGYLLGRAPGALVATIGIFLPAFVFVALTGPLIPRLRRSPTASAFLDGVNVVSLALMAVVTWHLGRSAIVDLPTVLLAVLGAILLFRFRLASMWLVAAGAAAGIALHALVR